jgi:hypothetical protein
MHAGVCLMVKVRHVFRFRNIQTKSPWRIGPFSSSALMGEGWDGVGKFSLKFLNLAKGAPLPTKGGGELSADNL